MEQSTLSQFGAAVLVASGLVSSPAFALIIPTYDYGVGVQVVADSTASSRTMYPIIEATSASRTVTQGENTSFASANLATRELKASVDSGAGAYNDENKAKARLKDTYKFATAITEDQAVDATFSLSFTSNNLIDYTSFLRVYAYTDVGTALLAYFELGDLQSWGPWNNFDPSGLNGSSVFERQIVLPQGSTFLTLELELAIANVLLNHSIDATNTAGFSLSFPDAIPAVTRASGLPLSNIPVLGPMPLVFTGIVLVLGLRRRKSVSPC